LPPSSPNRVPVQEIAAPAATMSLKFTSVNDTAAAVTVAGVPVGDPTNSTRWFPAAPKRLSVPFTVILETKAILFSPASVWVQEKLLQLPLEFEKVNKLRLVGVVML